MIGSRYKGSNHRDHILPVLEELHWLPIEYRINYKVLLLTQKFLVEKQPQYFTNMIQEYKPQRNLRSSAQHQLTQNLCNTSARKKSFSYASAALWNDLPNNMKSITTTDCFKKQLKTLFLLPPSTINIAKHLRFTFICD